MSDVIALSVDSTEEALEEVLAAGRSVGLTNWVLVARDLEQARADDIVDALAEYNLDVDELLK